MSVLVDSSVWIAYFRGAPDVSPLDWLIEEDIVAINALILAELTPPLLVRGERKLVSLLREIACLPLALDWDDITHMQVMCLRHGINKVGIPDLIIVQQVAQLGLTLWSLDRHFDLLARHAPFSLFGKNH